jgi:hypothetical protein
MNRMREHSQKLLDQVVLVSQELIRVAITWTEEWYNTLEVRSRWVGWVSDSDLDLGLVSSRFRFSIWIWIFFLFRFRFGIWFGF